MGKKITARILPILGLLFLTAYIRSATVDVVYTDYMRLINSYLPNVYSLKPYLQGDVLTRMPINYIERIINVGVFGYSTTFDMILGALGLTFIALVIGVVIASLFKGGFVLLDTTGAEYKAAETKNFIKVIADMLGQSFIYIVFKL